MNRGSLRVTMLLGLVLFVIGYNGIRLWTAISWAAILNQVNYQPSWLISALIAGLWISLGWIVFYGLYTKKTWSRNGVLVSAIAYLSMYWIERLAWQTPRANWTFALILQFILLAWIIYASLGVIDESHAG